MAASDSTYAVSPTAFHRSISGSHSGRVHQNRYPMTRPEPVTKACLGHRRRLDIAVPGSVCAVSVSLQPGVAASSASTVSPITSQALPRRHASSDQARGWVHLAPEATSARLVLVGTGGTHRQRAGPGAVEVGPSDVDGLAVEQPEESGRQPCDENTEDEIQLRVTEGQEGQILPEQHGVVEYRDECAQPDAEPTGDAMPPGTNRVVVCGRRVPRGRLRRMASPRRQRPGGGSAAALLFRRAGLGAPRRHSS